MERDEREREEREREEREREEREREELEAQRQAEAEQEYDDQQIGVDEQQSYDDYQEEYPPQTEPQVYVCNMPMLFGVDGIPNVKGYCVVCNRISSSIKGIVIYQSGTLCNKCSLEHEHLLRLKLSGSCS